jgi:flagellar hook-associated protein 3 FlgL
VNVNGQTLLGTDTVTSSAPPTFSAGSGGLFQTLVNLKLDLQNGQKDQVRLRIDQLSNDLNTVLGQQGYIGAIATRLDLTKNRIEDRKTILTQQYSSIQDIDTAKTISDLNYQQNIFQASLGVTGRVLQVSLLDYLR